MFGGGFPFPGMGGMGGMPGFGMAEPSGPVNNTKYYEVLGVSNTASETEIKKAFRKLAAVCHPDKGTLLRSILELLCDFDAVGLCRLRHAPLRVLGLGMAGN
jgi:hypothetical protein